MKKWIYIGGAVVVAAVILIVSLLQPPRHTQSITPTEPSNIPDTTAADRGNVVIYQCDPQLSQQWNQLAQAYTAQTGIPVTVITDEAGRLEPGMMDKKNAPTVFCLQSRQDLANWQDVCLDLTGSAIADALCSQDLALRTDDGIWGVAANVESYGLVYNASLLARAGYTEEDIKSFTSMKNVVQHITSGKKEFGFSAFATPNLSDTAHGGLTCLLAGLAHEPGALRTLWDLYSANCATPAASLIGSGDNVSYQEFLQEKAVFFLAGTWIYDELAEMDDNDLRILPVYTSDSQENLGLYMHCSGFWCVNANADEPDRQAALDFLGWLVSAQGDDPAPVDSLGLLAPYRDAAYAANPLDELVRKYLLSDREGVEWVDCDTLSTEKLAAFGQALGNYAAAPGDDAWQAVLDALQNGQ